MTDYELAISKAAQALEAAQKENKFLTQVAMPDGMGWSTNRALAKVVIDSYTEHLLTRSDDEKSDDIQERDA